MVKRVGAAPSVPAPPPPRHASSHVSPGWPMRRCSSHGPPRGVRRADSSRPAGRVLQGRCRKACGPLGSAARGIGGCRRGTCHMWPSLLLS